MLKTEVMRGTRGRIVIMDSISTIAPDDTGALVVSASHGGRSSGEFATKVPLVAAFFNDAGVGKEGAGIAALDMLQAAGVAGGTIAHTSARIGDATDTWENGIVSHVNEAARRLGVKPGDRLRDALGPLAG